MHDNRKNKSLSLWNRLTEPKGGFSRRIYLLLAALSFATLFVVWCVVTYSGWIRPFFLPTPTAVVKAGFSLLTEFGLLNDIKDSFFRVGMGFFLAVIVAVPLGILVGTFKAVEAIVEPINDFVRYMPVPVFVPLCILWVGIGSWSQITLIFIGTFFQLLVLVADSTARCPKEYLEVSYTLGGGRRYILTHIIFPYTLPAIYDNIRISFGWAWSYLLLAEIVAASTGLGHMIMESQRFLKTDNVIAGIIVIGLIGIFIDMLFKVSYKFFFPWAEK